MNLASFRDRLKGQPLAILGNGPSLTAHDPGLLGCALLGTNRSWSLAWATYHLTLELEHAVRDPEPYARMAKDGRLFVAGKGWPFGHVLTILNEGECKFSRDLECGVVVCVGGVGSVIFAGLQLAAWMGARPIYLLGVDLAGPHFHQGWAPSKTLLRQNELFALVPKDIEVYVVGSPESKAKFPHLSFEEACA